MAANMRNVAGAIVSAAVIGLLGTQLAGCHRSDGDTPPGKAAPAAAAPIANSQAGAHATDAQAGKRGLGAPHKGDDKPLWRSLTPAQQEALQPLQGEWDQMDGVRKQKWLQLASRFSAMKPEEQKRVQERMREWAKLTPEQRELARETYNRTRRIAPAQKTATWESYQQLPDEQKKKLAASATGRKAPHVVPSQASGKIVAPLGQGATSCPAGMQKNPVSATPPCVPGPVPVVTPPPAQPPLPIVPPATTPANPAPQPQQEKPQVPANWGITPNNA
jgi:hypothetical protein